MVSAVGKSPSEFIDELEAEFGKFVMVEDNLRFPPEFKAVLNKLIFEDKKIPEFSRKVVRVNYEDGCKVYFDNDDFVICRFSGTEPLLRIFAESNNAETATEYIKAFKDFLSI